MYKIHSRSITHRRVIIGRGKSDIGCLQKQWHQNIVLNLPQYVGTASDVLKVNSFFRQNLKGNNMLQPLSPMHPYQSEWPIEFHGNSIPT